MKRAILAVAVVTAGALSTAHADYVRIRFNLGVTKGEGPEQPGGPPGFPGSGMGGKMGGMGQPGMGQPGAGPGGIGGPPGIGGPGMGGGRPGFPGGMGQGQGMGGMGQGMGGMGQGQGMGMGMGQGGNQPTATEDDEESTPFYVEAIIEADHKDIKKNSQLNRYQIKHHWGKTTLHVPQDAVQTDTPQLKETRSRDVSISWYVMDTVAQQFAKRKNDMVTRKEPPDANQWLDQAEWALRHGLYTEVPKLVAEAAKKDPKNEIVVAFQKLDAAMKKPLPAEDGSGPLLERLGNYKTRQSAHYTLLYDVQGDTIADKRLKRMEDTYHAFFYWFALKGKALRVPERRLLAVLVDSKEAYEKLHKHVYDDVEAVADGFHAKRENVSFYCAKRLDDQYDGLSTVTKSFFNTWDRNALLQGKGFTNNQPAEQVIRAQTLTLLQQLLEEESEVTSISHEGTKQLLAATGLEGTHVPLLPRTVETPDWIRFGLASFFETPHGAFWIGTAAPSWEYLPKFKKRTDPKAKDKEKPEDALRHVVTDHGFRTAAAEKDPKLALTRARTMAWSLTYFLANNARYREGLLRYLQELASLPRDMEFDEDVLLNVFARSFDLMDAGKNELNTTKFYNLAKEWQENIARTNLDNIAAQNDAMKDRPELKTGSKKAPGK